MGTKRERSPGVWQLRVCANGKQVARTFRGSERKAAKALAAFEVEVGASPTRHGGPDMTVRQVMDAWWEQYEDELSPTTVREYRRLLDKRILPTFGDKRVRSLRVGELTAWYRELKDGGLSPRSVHQIHAVVRRALGFAMSQEWVDTNVAASAIKPKSRPRQLDIPDVSDVLRLIATAEAWDNDRGEMLAVIIRLAAATGMRRGELAALQWEDIDTEDGTILIRRSAAALKGEVLVKETKTGRARRVSLDFASGLVLNGYRTKREASVRDLGGHIGPYVFSTDECHDHPLNPDWITRAFYDLRKETGVIGVTFHGLRHFHVTQLLAAGQDVGTVGARVGHTQKSTTLNVYHHWQAATDQAAAEAIGRLLS